MVSTLSAAPSLGSSGFESFSLFWGMELASFGIVGALSLVVDVEGLAGDVSYSFPPSLHVIWLPSFTLLLG